MKTDSNSPPYDIAIIGGGIAGAGIARDAALRGLRVVLLEKNTFGSGTSSKSSKLIHGGIRYLDLAWTAFIRTQFAEAWKNLTFVFSSLRESRILRRIAPAWVKPHNIFIPIYTGTHRRRLTVFVGCLAYYVLGLLSGGGKMPRIVWSPRSALQIVPDLAPKDLNGGVMIRDHLTDDHGLVNATIASARAQGADCREHVEVLSYAYHSGSYTLKVHADGHAQEVQARKIINAAGPWIDEVRKASKEKEKNFIVPVAGAHIMMKKFIPNSVLLEAEDARIFFVINLNEEVCRIGTTERLAPTNPDKVKPTEDEIEYLLRSAERYFPEHSFTRNNVLDADAGVRPLASPERNRGLHEISREHEIRVSPSGVIHMLGVKLTDHRRAAEEVMDRLVPSLLPYNSKAKRKSSTHRIPL